MAKEFLVEGALCTCQLGTAPGKLKVVDNQFLKANGGKLMATTMTLGNVFEPPGFGMCNLNPSTPKPCMPAVTQWTGHFDSLRIGTGAFALTDESKATCATGMPNCIAPTTTGQIPIPSIKKWAEANSMHQSSLNPMCKLSSFTEHQIDVEREVGELRALPTTALKVPEVAPRAQISLPIFDPFEKPPAPPEKLRITAVQFTKEDYEAGDTIDEEASTPVEFCIEFNRPPLPSDKINCAFFTKYPGKPTYEKMPERPQEMKVPGQICFWSIIFNEKEAGATIACSFYLNSPALPRDGDGEQLTVRYVNLTSQEGTSIKEAYWSTERVAKFGEKSRERKEIKRNEDAFLHIHTRGLFGAEVTIKFYEKNGAQENRLLLQRIANIRDNCQSVVCPVSEIRDTFVQPWGDADVYATVEKSPLKQVSSGTIKLHLNDSAKNPTRDTMNGTGKFVIGQWPIGGGKAMPCANTCIIASPSKELIQEINIRLAGFGGCLPADTVTAQTTKSIKQFQRDYMEVKETGKICKHLLEAIDEFSDEYREDVDDYKCPCGTCDGFGQGQYKGEYHKDSKGNSHTGEEAFHDYEYPGMHQSLLWAMSAVRYYISFLKDNHQVVGISSAYRCWTDNDNKGRKTTNHMGKAVDVTFKKGNSIISGKLQTNLPLLTYIRDHLFVEYLDTTEWLASKLSTEPIGLGNGQTWSWIHLDVRSFSDENRDDSFFIKSNESENFNKKLINIHK